MLLDTAITPELRAEGWARDAVRLIQDSRRAEALVVTDRIAVQLTAGTPQLAAALDEWSDYIAEQVLAVELRVSEEHRPEATTPADHYVTLPTSDDHTTTLPAPEDSAATPQHASARREAQVDGMPLSFAWQQTSG